MKAVRAGGAETERLMVMSRVWVHVMCIGDWRSALCSSDVSSVLVIERVLVWLAGTVSGAQAWVAPVALAQAVSSNEPALRSARVRLGERRVGKEGRARWAPYH